jgi:tetrahydromethanopterin S-methyltransferase subunit G
MARIEGSFEQIAHRLGTMEQDLRMFREETSASFATIIARLDQTNARLDQTNARLDQTNARIDKVMYWMFGLVVALVLAVLGIVLTRVFFG